MNTLLTNIVHLFIGRRVLGICQISLTDSIIDEATLKHELLLLAAHTQKDSISKVLIHNMNFNPISSEFQQWAHTSLELPLLQSGVDKIAIVHPKNENVFALIHNNDTRRKRYFSSVDAAIAWLKE